MPKIDVDVDIDVERKQAQVIASLPDSITLQLSYSNEDFTVDVDVDVVDLRAQADASMPASNNNVNYTIYLISNYDVNFGFRFREFQNENYI